MRIRMPKLPPVQACPPHEWCDITDRVGHYTLRCAKCGQVYPPAGS